MTQDELKAVRNKISIGPGCLKLNTPRDLVPDTQRQSPSLDEPVAEVPREAARQGRVRIVVTSYRCRILDDDNLALGAKPLVDCCVEAGWLPSDAKIWCEIEHRQELIYNLSQERTEMLLEELVPGGSVVGP